MMGLNFGHVASKLGQRRETAGVTGEVMETVVMREVVVKEKVEEVAVEVREQLWEKWWEMRRQ